MCSVRILALLFIVARSIYCANILALTGLLSHSHHIWNEIIFIELAKQGHNVTVISHDKSNFEHPNLKIILLEGVYEITGAEKISEHLDEMAKNPKLMDVGEYWDYMLHSCNEDFKTNGFKTLMNYPDDFKVDLIFYDIIAGVCFYPFIRKFGNPPVIGLSPYGPQPDVVDIMGDFYHSYIPFYTNYYSGKMGFFERLQNTYDIFMFRYMRSKYEKAALEAIKHGFKDCVIDDFNDVNKHIQIALVNYHPVYNHPQSLAPNVIGVGGLHIKKPKQLPQELYDIAEKSTDGIIFFALGSNVHPEYMPEHFLNSMNDCFKTLKQTVFWKIDLQPGRLEIGKNVITRKWFPQNDILAHPKTKLFITHCGMLSMQQSIYHGVPMLGLPFFLDQIQNVKKIVAKGYGMDLDYNAINSKYVCGKIHEMLSNTTFKQNLKIAADKVQNNLNTPLEKAMYWINYVLKYKNVSENLLPLRDMNFIEILNLDILFCALVITVLILNVIFYVISLITCKLCFRKRKQE